jgi:hypothetical protein
MSTIEEGHFSRQGLPYGLWRVPIARGSLSGADIGRTPGVDELGRDSPVALEAVRKR